MGIAVVGIALALSVPAQAEEITAGDWLQFGFGEAGDAALGCDPADPTGFFCIASSGTPTLPLPTPPWTFTSLGAATLTVTDAFTSGEQFEIFDFGTSLGLTSLPSGGVDCGDDPVVCLATAGMSNRVFNLLAGNHSLTIVPTLSPEGGGSAYLKVDATLSTVPEPHAATLVGLGLIAMGFYRSRSKRISGATRQ